MSFADKFKKEGGQKGNFADKLKRDGDGGGSAAGERAGFAGKIGKPEAPQKQEDLKKQYEHKKNSAKDHVDSSKSSSLVYLVRGKDRGKPAWHYVLIENQVKKQLFLKQVSTGTCKVTDFGEILYSGWGEDPPQDIVDKVEKEYQ